MSDDTNIDKGRFFLAFFSSQFSTSILKEPETVQREKKNEKDIYEHQTWCRPDLGREGSFTINQVKIVIIP